MTLALGLLFLWLALVGLGVHLRWAWRAFQTTIRGVRRLVRRPEPRGLGSDYERMLRAKGPR